MLILSVPVSLLPLQLRQLRFHLRNQRLQLLLTFPARVCIDIPCMLFAVDPCRGVAALKQVVVDLADTAGVTIKLIRYFELAISTIYAFLISVEFMELVQSRDYKCMNYYRPESILKIQFLTVLRQHRH